MADRLPGVVPTSVKYNMKTTTESRIKLLYNAVHRQAYGVLNQQQKYFGKCLTYVIGGIERKLSSITEFRNKIHRIFGWSAVGYLSHSENINLQKISSSI